MIIIIIIIIYYYIILGGLQVRVRLSPGGPRFNPRCARDRPVEIYFSPFNTGNCVSLTARMTM